MLESVVGISKFFAALLIIFKVPNKIILSPTKLFSDLYSTKF